MLRFMTIVLPLVAAAPALAQRQFIIADRATDSLHRIIDFNENGQIDEPGELNVWFDASNAAGTLGPMNPTALAIRGDGLVVMGDQVNRLVYWLRDVNLDGDAQDAGESVVAADAANASGVSFAFPTGVAFDAAGAAYVVNAGNSFGNDGIYALVDLNGDGDAQDAGEVTPYVAEGAFGPGNGPYSPQEIVFDAEDAGFLRNSSANLHGIYRFVDLDGNGRADDPGEFTAWFDATNGSAVPVSAGFALEIDPVRPRALYTHQLASGGIDQVVRAQDLDNDGDAQDAGEAVMVFESGQASFTVIDLVALADGSVLLTDNSGKKIYRLVDLNGDGLFSGPDESTIYFDNLLLGVTDIRQAAVLPTHLPHSGDVDGDGVFTAEDAPAFAAALASPEASSGEELSAADVNGDGTADGNDIQWFVDLLLN